MKQSHIIPRHYLEQFAIRKRSADFGQLWVYRKIGAPFHVATNRIGKENGYFAFINEDGSYHEEMEDLVQKIENRADDLIRFLSNDTFVWQPGHRPAFAEYMALLHARSTARRKHNEIVSMQIAQEFERLSEDPDFVTQYQTTFKERGASIAAEPRKAVMKRQSTRLQQTEEIRNAFLQTLLHNTQVISRSLIEKPWQVLIAPEEQPFITTDVPLITGTPINGHLLLGEGFNKPGVLVIFPLSPRACLLAGQQGHERIRVDADHVSKINRNLIMCMDRFAYSAKRSEAIDEVVKQVGNTIKYGVNAFMKPLSEMPQLREELLKTGSK